MEGQAQQHTGGVSVVQHNETKSDLSVPATASFQPTRQNLTRLFKLWPGNNLFLCGGRCMTGPADGLGMLGLSFVFVVGPTALMGVALFQSFPGHLAAIMYSICLLSTALTVGLLLKTALTDPGVLPRASKTPSTALLPHSIDYSYAGNTVRLTLCRTCNIYRSIRCSHCAFCDNCVDRFDHHCPWVANCIGRRNYKYFYGFLASATVQIFLFISICIAIFEHVSSNHSTASPGATAVIAKTPFTMAVICICALFTLSVCGLFCYHTSLIFEGKTTRESIKELPGSGVTGCASLRELIGPHGEGSKIPSRFSKADRRRQVPVHVGNSGAAELESVYVSNPKYAEQCATETVVLTVQQYVAMSQGSSQGG